MGGGESLQDSLFFFFLSIINHAAINIFIHIYLGCGVFILSDIKVFSNTCGVRNTHSHRH